MKKFNNPYIYGGDAFVLLWENKYYLYCTREDDRPINWSVGWLTDNNGKDGFEVFVSKDMENWTNLGYCLEKGDDVLGNGLFWAPEVYFRNGKFYMTYSADEHLAIAVSDKPEGPFKKFSQDFILPFRAIDSHFFFDDDGRVYLYYADLSCGNRVFVTEMKEDLSGAKSDEKILLIKSQDGTWENISNEKWTVSEGPFLLKHNGYYYLTYSCNNVMNPDYAVGYAISKSPLGPFERYEGNPILIGKGKLKGYGHHSFVVDKDNELICVHHCHNPFNGKVKPRMVCFEPAEFLPSQNGGADILKIYHE